MLGNLFIRSERDLDFETFSKQIFALLRVSTSEMRDSENAPGGRYVYGAALGLRVVLTEADDSDFPEFDFLLSFRPETDWATIDRHSLDGLADIVAKYLAQTGLRIARPLDFGKAGTRRVEYGK